MHKLTATLGTPSARSLNHDTCLGRRNSHQQHASCHNKATSTVRSEMRAEKTSREFGKRLSVPARLLMFLVMLYRRSIGLLVPPCCRFTPSCSAYAMEALEQHGAMRGTWLTVRRLLRCAPWHPGGTDLVPPPAARLDHDIADSLVDSAPSAGVPRC